MPISANPPVITVTALTIPIRHKRPNGNMRINSAAKGTHINTASTALRISKSPNSRPASVKFTGITTVISSIKFSSLKNFLVCDILKMKGDKYMNKSYYKDITALTNAQNGFRGVAEDLGITNDDDIVEMVKEIRKERENKQKRS